jgi:hypothetical protein
LVAGGARLLGGGTGLLSDDADGGGAGLPSGGAGGGGARLLGGDVIVHHRLGLVYIDVHDLEQIVMWQEITRKSIVSRKD